MARRSTTIRAARTTNAAASSFGQVNQRSANRNGVQIASRTASRAALHPASRRTSPQRARKIRQLNEIIAIR